MLSVAHGRKLDMLKPSLPLVEVSVSRSFALSLLTCGHSVTLLVGET